MSENNEKKNIINEQELNQVSGGAEGAAHHVVIIRFRCPNCGNVRSFTDSIGSITCDCGTTMKPCDSYTT